MSLFTVDASVFISAFISTEIHHSTSQACLARLRAAGDGLRCPALLLVEVAAALARNTRDVTRSQSFALSLASLPGMRLLTLNKELVQLAVQTAAESRLRGADAVYAAVAIQQDATLITWDQQMLTRAATLAQVVTPEHYCD